MRFVVPQIGDRRTKRKFLFFPKKINGIKRWLEMASWKEFFTFDSCWKPLEWTDLEYPITAEQNIRNIQYIQHREEFKTRIRNKIYKSLQSGKIIGFVD